MNQEEGRHVYGTQRRRGGLWLNPSYKTDYKYIRDPSEEKWVEKFLEEEGVEESKRQKIVDTIQGMGTIAKDPNEDSLKLRLILSDPKVGFVLPFWKPGGGFRGSEVHMISLVFGDSSSSSLSSSASILSSKEDLWLKLFSLGVVTVIVAGGGSVFVGAEIT